jgi:Kef-type K+ transport system membrane component KefB
MESNGDALLVIGAVLLAGVAAGAAAPYVHVPRVTLMILLGVLVGPGGLDVLPARHDEWFPVVATIALSMIGFLVGGELRTERLRGDGARTATIAVLQAAATAAVVAVCLLAVGFPAQVALPLAGIAAATDPASTVAVIQEVGRGGRLSRVLLGVVAIDDVVTIGLFSLLVSAATVVAGGALELGVLRTAAWDVAGAVAVGAAVGVPAAFATGRLQPGRPTAEEAFGAVLVCAGISVWLDVSFLLAAVVLGAVVANLATHHERPFREIENLEWFVLGVFFILAGAELRVAAVRAAGALGAAFVLLRGIGKILGGSVAARTAGASAEVRRWLGTALLPQAGVALGLALLGAQRFPDVADQLVAVVVVSTVFFEVVGTVTTRVALRHGDSPSRG